MSDPKEQLVDAFAAQGNAEWQYAGTDAWESTTLKRDTKIAQIEWRAPKEATKPYSPFFTDIAEIERHTGPDGGFVRLSHDFGFYVITSG